MGLDLNLFPIDNLGNNGFGYSHTVLSIGRVGWDLGAEIKKRARLLPEGHDITSTLGGRIPDGHHKGERCYGRLTTDGYGEPYRWITAHALLPFLREHWPGHPATAFVRALPDLGLIVLDWH